MERFSHLVVALGFLAFLFSIPGSRAVMGAGPAVSAQHAQYSWPGHESASPPNSLALPGPFGEDDLQTGDALPEQLDALLERLADLNQRVGVLSGDPARTFSVLLGTLGQRVEALRDQLDSLEADQQSVDLFLSGMGAALEVMERAMDEAEERAEFDRQVWI
jgi:hypothetical protein